MQGLQRKGKEKSSIRCFLSELFIHIISFFIFSLNMRSRCLGGFIHISLRFFSFKYNLKSSLSD